MPYTATQIAHVCHAANRALQIEQNDPTIPVSPRWDKLDEETRQSAIQGVQNILDGKVTTPEQSHIEWMRFKHNHGWKLGPVKDEDKREHPLLVSYIELPVAQRIKDALFFAIVQALGSIQVPLVNVDKTNEAFREGVGEGQ